MSMFFITRMTPKAAMKRDVSGAPGALQKYLESKKELVKFLYTWSREDIENASADTILGDAIAELGGVPAGYTIEDPVQASYIPLYNADGNQIGHRVVAEIRDDQDKPQTILYNKEVYGLFVEFNTLQF